MTPELTETPGFPGGSVRAFVAVALPPAVLDALSQLLQDWKRRVAPGVIRWARAPQLHLTLQFLGNVPGAEVSPLSLALTNASAGVRSFELCLERLGGFPDLRVPRVVWIGLGGATDRLGDLQQRILQAVGGFGSHREDRPFQPHLTLGRVTAPGPEARRVGDLVRETRVAPFCSWSVRDFRLMRSELRPDGARYTELARVPLAG
jgi:RNA 2',3'-cyclic 3'-phosphodiesterase